MATRLMLNERQMELAASATSTSDDYRRHLGLVSTARRDFEALTERLADPSPKTGPQVERIILYIDDLDRCAEGRVKDVLEAVHLLLAFKLFVVVVGVDSRWLTHSLDKVYGAFDEEGGADERRSTPQDYLEKIFQIIVNLRPMTPLGFGQLMSRLMGATAPPEPGEDDGVSAEGTAEGAPTDAASEVNLVPAAAGSSQRPSRRARRGQSRLKFSRMRRRPWLQRLNPRLRPSPRPRPEPVRLTPNPRMTSARRRMAHPLRRRNPRASARTTRPQRSAQTPRRPRRTPGPRWRKRPSRSNPSRRPSPGSFTPS